MIETVFKIPMGKLLASYKSIAKNASSAICVIKHEGESPTNWIAILHPDDNHSSLARIMTNDPVKLWRAMSAASKICHPTDEAVAIAVAIADISISIDDPCFENAEHHLKYGYNAEKLRAEVFSTEPTPSDIQKIVAGFKLIEVPIDDPFAETQVKEESPSCGIFPHIMGIGIGMKSLPLAI